MSPPTLTDFRVGQNLAREARQISPPRRHSGSVARTDGVGGPGEAAAVASVVVPASSAPSVPIGPPFTILSTCKGGGYRYCRTDPPHPKANAMGLYPLHRVLMENKLGRLLEPGEVVHHADEDKSNDSIDNLELKDNREHAREHRLAQSPGLVECVCPVCLAVFTLKPHHYRLAVRRGRTGQPTCGRRCGGILSRRAVA